ncbi:MAG: hypothetical protein WC674_09900 [Candidatus Krumholzibacteriia bacterium]
MTKSKPERISLPPDLLTRLYGAARAFREIECWRWMWDSDLFGVQNPVDGEISYCCIMGRNGEHFAISAYTGTEGLESYYRIADSETHFERYESYFSQICLAVSFEDREILNPEDVRMLRQTGYTARGPHVWPQIRSHGPGLEPWYVNAEEAASLIHILEQAIQVALRFKENPDLLDSPGGEEYLVRIPEEGPNGLEWRDGWVLPPVADEPPDIAAPLDEVRMARIKKTIPRSSNVWEMGCFYAPGRVVGEGVRPYFPRMTLFVDHESGLVLFAHSSEPGRFPEQFPAHIMGSIEKTRMIPATMLTGEIETLRMLAPIASALGFEAELSDDLPCLTEAIESMFEYFTRPGAPGADGFPPAAAPKRGRSRKTPRRR